MINPSQRMAALSRMAVGMIPGVVPGATIAKAINNIKTQPSAYQTSRQMQPSSFSPLTPAPVGSSIAPENDPLRQQAQELQQRMARNNSAASFRPARQLGNPGNSGFDSRMQQIGTGAAVAHNTKMNAVQAVLGKQLNTVGQKIQQRDQLYAQDYQGAIGGTMGGATWPVNGRITSQFGTRTFNGKTSQHAGMDIAARGAVRAMHGGTVIRVVAGRVKGQVGGTQLAKGRTGNGVLVRHSDGTTALYGHVAPGVKVGQVLSAGQVLGQTDLSGVTTGHHLHFEVWNPSGVPINPRSYLR